MQDFNGHEYADSGDGIAEDEVGVVLYGSSSSVAEIVVEVAVVVVAQSQS